MLSDLHTLSDDLARLEMDRDSCDIVFVVSNHVDDKRVDKIYSLASLLFVSFLLKVSHKIYERETFRETVRHNCETQDSSPNSMFDDCFRLVEMRRG